jgi:hypothetical protein
MSTPIGFERQEHCYCVAGCSSGGWHFDVLASLATPSAFISNTTTIVHTAPCSRDMQCSPLTEGKQKNELAASK